MELNVQSIIQGKKQKEKGKKKKEKEKEKTCNSFRWVGE